MIRVVGPSDPADLQAQAINTTSRSVTWSRNLSPFLVGPIDLYSGHKAENLENAWQYSKVYPVHFDEDKDEVKQDYFDWAKMGWSNKRGVRYPMGKRKPLFSLWEGQRLDYVTARKKIYAPLYSKAVEKTYAWRQLKQEYNKTGNIVLWDFDSYDHNARGMSWNDVMNNDKDKMGHGFVLAMMLEGKLKEAIS